MAIKSPLRGWVNQKDLVSRLWMESEWVDLGESRKPPLVCVCVVVRATMNAAVIINLEISVKKPRRSSRRLHIRPYLNSIIHVLIDQQVKFHCLPEKKNHRRGTLFCWRLGAQFKLFESISHVTPQCTGWCWTTFQVTLTNRCKMIRLKIRQIFKWPCVGDDVPLNNKSRKLTILCIPPQQNGLLFYQIDILKFSLSFIILKN